MASVSAGRSSCNFRRVLLPVGLRIVPDTCVSIQGLFSLETILFHFLERNILGFAQEAEPLLSVSVMEANEEEEVLLDRDSERQEGDGGG